MFVNVHMIDEKIDVIRHEEAAAISQFVRCGPQPQKMTASCRAACSSSSIGLHHARPTLVPRYRDHCHHNTTQDSFWLLITSRTPR